MSTTRSKPIPLNPRPEPQRPRPADGGTSCCASDAEARKTGFCWSRGRYGLPDLGDHPRSRADFDLWPVCRSGIDRQSSRYDCECSAGGGVEVLHDALTRLALRGSTTLGIGFLVSLVISLWLTSSGVSALFDALNIVCEEEELGRVVKAGGPVRLLEYVRPQQTVRRALARLWEPWISWAYGASFGLAGRLLDAGVGTGRNFPFFPSGKSRRVTQNRNVATAPSHYPPGSTVVGIDISPAMRPANGGECSRGRPSAR